MVDTHHLLVLGPDAGLVGELRSAAGPLDGLRVALQHETEAARGVERAADRRPAMVVLDDRVGSELLGRLARDLREAGYTGPMIVTVRPDVGGGMAEGSSDWLDLLRSGVSDFLSRPVSSTDLERAMEGVRGSAGPSPSGAAGEPGRVVMFSSNKGGVGKSTLAVNVAAALAKRQPERVLLVDASLQMGTCAALLDLDSEVCISDVVRERERLDGTLLRSLARVHECGLHVLPAPRDAVEAADVDEASLARALSVARRTYDWVIVDSFPMLDGLAMAALDLCDRVFVVTSGSVPTVRGTAAYLALLARLGIPAGRLRIVWNRSRPGFSGSLSGADLAATLGRAPDHVVPFSKSFLVGADQGVPPALAGGRFSGARRAVDSMARALRKELAPGADAGLPVGALR